VITTIALDHTHVLGTTLAEVAGEKAGIIKSGVPVVCGIEDEGLLEMIKNTCQEKNSLLHSTKEMLSFTKKDANLQGQTFNITGLGPGYEDMTINLLGEHQIANACIAALVVDVMRKKGMAVSETALKKGFNNVKWPARFQVVQREPAILLDCAHNPAGMRTLKRAMEDYFSKQRLTLVLGIMRDKDIPGIVKEIAPFAHNIIITKPKFERAAEPSVIEAEARKYSDNIVVINSVSEALAHAQRNATKYDVICVCGSIFNVGEAMEVFGIDSGNTVE
jgi:dihydrofolate synthase/folylpolyglutamate synthase